MSIKRKFITTVGLALAVGTFSTFVAAQDNSSNTTNPTDSTKKERTFEGRGGRAGMRGGKHEGGDRMMMGALQQLNLSDSQKAQIKTIFDSHKPDRAQFDQVRGLMQKKHDGTITAEEQATLDTFKAQRKANEEQIHNSILAVLTDDQRAQLEQMKQNMKQHRQDRQEMRMPNQSPNKTDNN